MSTLTEIETSKPTPGARDVVALSWPMTLKAMFLHGTVVIDGLLVSPLGEEALAAMGLAAAFAGLVSGGVFAFSNALQLRTAQAYGSGDLIYRKSVLASGLTIGLFIGVMGSVLLLLLGPTLLGLFADQAITQLAWSYLSIFSVVLITEGVGQNLASHCNGCGRSKQPFIGYCISVPINVAVSAVLIHGLMGAPALGIAGAAIGSAIAVSLQAAYLVMKVWREDGRLYHVRGWRQGSYMASLRRHLSFSWPIAITVVSANYAQRVCMLIYAQMSVAAFAAMTLIMPWVIVAGTIGMQWAQATGILVAQLLGDRRSEADLDAFLSSAWRVSFIAAACVAGVYLALIGASGTLYQALTDDTQAILTSFVFALLVLPFPKQSNAICGNTLRASGDTIYVMHLFVWSQWLFRVPATAVAVLYLGLSPAWVLSLLFWEEIIKLPAFHRRLWLGDWKRSDVS